MLRPALLLATLLAAAVAGAQNSPDAHYLARRTNAIAHKSVFVHGYLHGYEEGFHIADQDIHMARGARDIVKCKEAKVAEGYHREFGDKHFFQVGYREGVRVGYADGMAGRAFRAINQIETIGAFTLDAPAGSSDPAFDRGFSLGYSTGQHQGVQDGRSDASVVPPLPACPPPPARAGDARSFCSAFVGGYRVGYSDGFTNVTRRATAQVESRAGK